MPSIPERHGRSRRRAEPAEIQLLLPAARPGFERTLFETAYLTGAREGELLALRWTDLELPKEGPARW